MVENLDTFTQSLDFKKVRLGQRTIPYIYPINPGHRHLVTGGKKYSRRNKGDEWLPLLLLGSKRTNSARGKKSSMATKTIKALKRAKEEVLLFVCEIDENFDSKVCCLCHQQSNKCKKAIDNLSRREVSLWGVLQCKICHHNWDRDKSACYNFPMLLILNELARRDLRCSPVRCLMYRQHHYLLPWSLQMNMNIWMSMHFLHHRSS
ncbi:hypothetical protein K501DRAFT_266966 [Backusella circina FSU 941]|nr:hypothetical protein K501DRAFT_266966 [Backusella circina FSU 941]